MAWIETVEPENAEADLAAIYQAIGASRGGIADVHRAQSLNPRALRAHLELYKAVVFARSPLGRVARERIAVVVSAANRCAYCVAHHGAALGQLGDAPAVVEALARGETPEALPAAEVALLRWASMAASSPSECRQDAIADLRGHGYDDRAILDAALTVGYFSFVNRLVLVLGVAIEGDFEKTCGDAGDRSD